MHKVKVIMGTLKPTLSAKRAASVPSRRPMESHVGSDPKAEAEVRRASGNSYESDLNSARVRPKLNQSRTRMQGPGLSVPGIAHPRRAGSKRKYKY